MDTTRKSILLIWLVGMILSACSGSPLKPEAALWGEWAYAGGEGGDLAYAADLIFQEDGTLAMLGRPQIQATYVVIAPGQLKLTFADQSEVIRYQATDDLLTLIFQEGQYAYRRIVTAPPTAEVSLIFEQKTPTSAPEALLPTEMPVLAAPTQTSFVVEMTPVNTPTQPAPSVEPADYITPMPEKYFPLNSSPSLQSLSNSFFVVFFKIGIYFFFIENNPMLTIFDN